VLCSAFPRTRNHPTGNDFFFIALTDRCDREAAQLRDQLGVTGGVITHRRALLLGQHHDVQTILRHIDTAEREHCHLRIPSLLMRGRAQQLFGYGRSDWGSKLIRGLTSETAAGFPSLRRSGYDPTPVTPHNAPFPTYKTARVHHAARRRGDVADRSAAQQAAVPVVDFLNNASADPYAPIVAPVSRGWQMSCAAKTYAEKSLGLTAGALVGSIFARQPVR
jgi:hypothetical protein